MKKFFVFLIIIAGCLFLLYKTGNLSIDAIKAQFVSEEINNNSIGGTATQAVESQKSLMPEGNKGMEEQVIGGVGGAVREGNALIEGNKVCENGIITNEAYKGMVEKHLSIKGYDTSLHTWTEFYSKTLGKVVLIDNNKKNGSRQVYDVDGTRFYRVGEGFKDRPIEEELQTYVAMKGLANAIDGK